MQRILEFLKQHYDKIILCVVLIGLATAGVMLPKQAEAVKESVAAPPPPPSNPEAMTPLDIGPLVSAIQQLTNPPALVLSGDHNLFNPVVWKREANGNLIKILKTGADALIVTNITPLYQRIGLDHPSGDGYFMFTQAHSGRRTNEYAKMNEKPKSGLYIIRDTKGSADDLTQFQLQLEILDTGEKVWITKDRPFERVDGQVVDLRYPPESNLNLSKKHLSDTFTLDGDMYKIVAITNNAATVQQLSTTKQTTVPWSGNTGAESKP
jgi:hypothetical protein